MNLYEEVSKGFERLGLSDKQVLHLKSIGVPPEAAKCLIEKWNQIGQDINKSLEALASALSGTGSIDALKELGITIQERYKTTQIKRRKGKSLKPWQKNNFYQ